MQEMKSVFESLYLIVMIWLFGCLALSVMVSGWILYGLNMFLKSNDKTVVEQDVYLSDKDREILKGKEYGK